MAIITLERGSTAQRIAAGLKAMTAAAGAVLDSYVGYRMQTSASEANRAHQPMARGHAVPCRAAALKREISK